VERTGSEFVSVERDLERVVSLLRERERGGVRAVVVVVGGDVDSGLVGHHHEFVSSKRFVVTVFVACLDGEREVREPCRRVVCS